jgi:D-glycero-D-manno-heptose 1,7-bisphosphate phosphatase
MKLRAVFLDLNGTLVRPVTVDRLADLEVIPGAGAAVARLCHEGFVCPVVTVQSRIEKGVFTDGEFRAWFAGLSKQLAAEGGHVLGPYVCPHRYATPCRCAKPQGELYRGAAEELGVDMRRSYTIGDTASDVEAGVGIGAKGCLVLTGEASGSADRCSAGKLASFVGRDLAAVVAWIIADKAAQLAVAPDAAHTYVQPSSSGVAPRR